MRDLSAPVALSRKITGDDRHRWSYIYEWTSDQGLEWALKPPLQSLCGWRRNAQTCRSWSNDQLSSAFTAPAARLSSRTVQQNQRWSPELPYSSRTGPIQQRADERQKAATSPAQPRLQGQKISQGVIKGYRGGRRRKLAARLAAHPGVGSEPPSRAAQPSRRAAGRRRPPHRGRLPRSAPPTPGGRLSRAAGRPAYPPGCATYAPAPHT